MLGDSERGHPVQPPERVCALVRLAVVAALVLPRVAAQPGEERLGVKLTLLPIPAGLLRLFLLGGSACQAVQSPQSSAR